ncbi:MFS transporter [Dyadobacter psychrotolerans]|uniref:MFS transporter n=1 Tax=Dyadobacter psychrotolerans TaxID=2541721 RepID=A0A4R5D6X4_9BACT|nr:MFS transporter [Dyadobacter psychrotolerans]TDE09229.1 MFS transporter [Dyadobacter psychrotolerans]
MYNRGLFHDWVPKPVQLLLILIFAVVIFPANGIYSGNISDMVGSLGSLSEDIQMANNATTIGMMVVFPLLLRTKQYFRTKELVIGSLMMVSLLSIIAGNTDNAYILVFCSFLIGFFKMFGMIEVMLPIMFILSPGGDRGRFYALFYPFSIILGQLSGFFTTRLAYETNWQNAYVYMAMLLSGTALLAIIFMHNLRGSKKVPLYQFDWLGMVLLSICLLSVNYVLVYAKQQDWFSSLNIQAALAIFLTTLVGFIYLQSKLKRPYISLDVFYKKNVYNSLLMIFLMGMFMASSSIQSAFTTNVLHYDSPTNASLNLMMVPGIILGGLVSFIWFKKKWWLKSLALLGFGAYQSYAIYMYFLISPVIEIESLILPTILRGFAMCLLFVTIGFYNADKLQMAQMLSASAIMVAVRTFLGPAFFGAALSWAQYKLQLQHMTNLAGQMDSINPVGPEIYGSIQMQAVLLASKELFGYIIMAGWAVLLYVSFHRFRPIHRRRMILFLKRWRYRESIEDYRVGGEVSAGAL